MHKVMLVRGGVKNTKKHWTCVYPIVWLRSKAPVCVLCKHIYTTVEQTAQERSAGLHLQVQVSSTIWRETSIQEARKSRGGE